MVITPEDKEFSYTMTRITNYCTNVIDEIESKCKRNVITDKQKEALKELIPIFISLKILSTLSLEDLLRAKVK